MIKNCGYVAFMVYADDVQEIYFTDKNSGMEFINNCTEFFTNDLKYIELCRYDLNHNNIKVIKCINNMSYKNYNYELDLKISTLQF